LFHHLGWPALSFRSGVTVLSWEFRTAGSLESDDRAPLAGMCPRGRASAWRFAAVSQRCRLREGGASASRISLKIFCLTAISRKAGKSLFDNRTHGIKSIGPYRPIDASHDRKADGGETNRADDDDKRGVQKVHARCFAANLRSRPVLPSSSRSDVCMLSFQRWLDRRSRASRGATRREL
jgi:hypothetical protein